MARGQKLTHRGSSKIKYEHSMIPGLRELLEEIEPWSEIKSIFPGEIRRGGKNVGLLKLTVQYQTTSGIKCLAKGRGSVQEVFIVSSNQGDELEKRLKEKFFGGG